MKKVMTIRLGHYVLTVDEDAAELIADYSLKLRNKYRTEASGEEIIEDIEERMGELLKQRQDSSLQTYSTAEDVKAVLEQLGPVEETENASDSKKEFSGTDVKKRLFRDTDNGLIGGVCSGLAAYFGIDTVVVRLVMIVAAVFLGFGVPLYIILWAITPEARSTADRLMMQGRNPNLQNIENSVKSEFRKVEERFNRNSGRDDIFRIIIRNIIAITVFFFRLIGWAVATALITALIALIVALTADFTSIEISNLHVYGTKGINEILSLPWGNPWIAKVILISFLISAIISIILNIGSIRRRVRPEFKIAGRWLIAANLLLFAASIVTVFKGFSTLANPSADYTPKQQLSVKGDTLYLASFHSPKDESGMWILNELAEIRTSPDSFYHLEIRNKYFRGLRNERTGKSIVPAEWKTAGDTLMIGESREYQHILNQFPGYHSYIIYVPENKFIRFTRNFGFPNTNYSESGGAGTLLKVSRGNKMTQGGKGVELPVSEHLSELEIEGLFDVHVFESPVNRVELISGPVRNHAEWTDNKRGLLYIKQPVDFREHHNSARSVIHIYTNDLSRIHAEATARVYFHNFETERISIDASAASRINGHLETKTLNLNISAASEAFLRGHSDMLSADVEAASGLDAHELKCREARIDVQGASQAQLWVTENIEADVTGASKITLKGNPAVSRLESHGGSVIDRR